MNAVDTNVFVYGLDDDHPDKRAKARVFEIAFVLHTRFSLSHWDSMLLAACKEAGVTTLYSEDMDPGSDYDGLNVINPFA